MMCNKNLIENILQVVVNYQKQSTDVEDHFIGLPYGPASLVKSLITLANATTGIVSGISYSDLARLMTINPAPGRKDCGTPSKQTIRNYIKSIERDCGDYFKVISDGQNLKFLFPELPKKFNDIIKIIDINTEVNIEDNTTNSIYPIDNASKRSHLNEHVNTEVNIDSSTEVNIPEFAVKKLLLNKNKQTQETNKHDGASNFSHHKKTISEYFQPSQETVTIALAQGLIKVTDMNEIKKFIQHNLDQQTRWEDYNNVFLSWLKHDFYFNSKKKTETKSDRSYRSNENVSSSNKPNSFEAAMDAVKQHNPNACHPTKELFPASRIITLEDPALKPRPHLMGVDSNDGSVRSIIYQ